MRLLDVKLEHHAHVARRLATEPVIWLGTVRPDGTPHTAPVWFVWDDPDVTVFSMPGTRKVRNVEANRAVTLSLDTRDGGNDVVLLDGTARLEDPSVVTAPGTPAFVGKYGERLGAQTPEEWAAVFSQPLRITVTRLRAWRKVDGALEYLRLP